MEIKIIHSADRAYEFLRDKIKYNYIYQFSDLDEEQWSNVICYGLFDDNELKEIAMLLINYDIPVLLAASYGDLYYCRELIKRIKKYLPSRFYTHMDMMTLKSIFSQDETYDLEEYMNMGLCDYSRINIENYSEAMRLGYKDLGAIKKLIAESYPEAWLDDELVKLNENFGVFANGKLVSFAGIHAYSRKQQVAAVAHVTTHPDYRNRGYGKEVVGALVNSLKDKVEIIGLNVKVDNVYAINCYKKLGFKEFGRFAACEIGTIIK